MIILEGPDGSGKTTLALWLADRVGFPIAPRVVSTDTEPLVDLVEWVDDNLSRGWQRTIFDRHRLISEPIYGPLIRSKLEPGFDDLLWIRHKLIQFYSLEPVIIFCLPPVDVVWKNVKGDDTNSLFQDEDLCRRLWASYFNRAVLDQTFYLSSYIYDYTNPDSSRVIDDAILRTDTIQHAIQRGERTVHGPVS